MRQSSDATSDGRSADATARSSDPEPKRPASAGEANSRPPATRSGPPAVLVVEDDPAVADAVATLLDNSGYTAVVTVDAAVVLRHARAADVDLVLLDLDLRALPGLDLCRQVWVAARAQNVPLPILTLTSAVGPEALCAGYAAGADDYVPKPFHPAELLARVRVCLQLRGLSRAALRQPEPLRPSGGAVRRPGQPRAALEADDVAEARVERLQVAGALSPDRPAPPIPDREALLPELTEPLTAREFEVLVLLASRHSNKEIAGVLCLSWQTVAKHTNNIYQKLRVPGRRDAVERARALGILPAHTGLAHGS